MSKKIFVHILLFECHQCGAPIDSVLATDCSNPEEVDSQEILLLCKCNWECKSHGFAAKRRLIVAWEPQNAQVTQSVHRDSTILGIIPKERPSHAVRPEN